MIDNLPASHIAEAYELDADGKIDLFKISLNQLSGGTMICLTAKIEVSWQGMVFESIPISLAGEGVNTNGEWKRPKLTIANPDGIWSAFIMQGKVDNAQVTRYRVSLNDLKNNAGIYQMNVWRISKPVAVGRPSCTFELRSPLDGQQFLLPGRAFYPPEYPHVSL